MMRFVAKKIILSTTYMGNVKINITKPSSANNKSGRPSNKVLLNKMNLFVRSVKMQGLRSKQAKMR